MAGIVYIVVGVVVVIAIIVAVITLTRRRTERLHNTFGPEYDRTVQTTGDRKAAEKELAGRVDRRKQLDIVPLSEVARQQYATEWRQVQANFVDAPVQSIQQADALVVRVMTDRGYPMAEFDQRASDVSVDHPNVVENYRSAHAIASSNAQTPNTEELRKAMTQYRALFDELLESTGAEAGPNDAQERQYGAAATGATAGRADSPPPPPVASPTSDGRGMRANR